MYLIEGVLTPSTNPLTICHALCLAETTKTPDATSRKESSALIFKVQTYVWNSRTRKHLTIYFNRKRPTSFLRNKSYSYCHIPCALLALSSERVWHKDSIGLEEEVAVRASRLRNHSLPALLLVLLFIPCKTQYVF